MTETMPNREGHQKNQNFAVMGLVIALLAFSLSVTTPWILNEFAPPAPTLEDVAVEKALSIKEKLINAIKVVEKAEAVPPKENPKHWTDYWSLIIILIALGGIVNGVLGFVKSDNRWIGGTAIGFGILAIVAQYMLIALAVIILILLVGTILSSLGIDL